MQKESRVLTNLKGFGCS